MEAAADSTNAGPDSALTKKRKLDELKTKRTKASPGGLSINWQVGDSDVELTVGARGIRNGKKPKTAADYIKLQSRLCRAALLQHAHKAFSLRVDPHNVDIGDTEETRLPLTLKQYQRYKKTRACATHLAIQQLIFEQGPLAGWLIGDGINNCCAAETRL